MYIRHKGELIVSDSEVDEMPWLFDVNQVNLFPVLVGGSAVPLPGIPGAPYNDDPGVLKPWASQEPTGLAYDPASHRLFVSNDEKSLVYFVQPGTDGYYGTPDDWPSTRAATGHLHLDALNTDIEDITYNPVNGHLYGLDGVGSEVFDYSPGPDGQFNTGDEPAPTHFDMFTFGAADPEGIVYYPAHGTLLVLEHRTELIFEVSLDGSSLLQAIDVAAAGSLMAASLALAPAGDGSAVTHVYITDRGVDNAEDPLENDGKMYEMAAGFDSVMHTITPSVTPGGSISPSGAQTVMDGGDKTFTITPDPGYHVLDVLVDGVSVGAVTSYTFTEVTADHTIAATLVPDSFTITASSGLHGSIDPTGAISVAYGTDRTFTITPAIGYHVVDVLVDGVSVGAVTSYTFTAVAANHTIAASFGHVVTASAGAGGSIDPSGTVGVADGADKTFTITPATGYHVLDVLVDGVSVGAVTTYTFSGVTADHTIAATFEINVYTITATVAPHGQIDPAGDVSVTHGTDKTFTITADPGYHVLNVFVDGVSVGAVTSYTFTAVASDHTIAATFALNAYTITASAGANGCIDPTGAVSVAHGADQTFTITPATGYHVARRAGGRRLGGGGHQLHLHSVAANHTIAASFAHRPIDRLGRRGRQHRPVGAVRVADGADQTFTITPATGYHVARRAGGRRLGRGGQRPTPSATSPPTTPSRPASPSNNYTITASAGANGTIDPTGAVTVAHGADQTFTITPATGYHVADVLVDGVSVGAVTTYTFSDVTADHTIAASFALEQLHHHRLGRRERQHRPDRGRVRRLRRRPDLHHHPGHRLPRRSTCWWTASRWARSATYTFSDVTADHTIAASFALEQLHHHRLGRRERLHRPDRGRVRRPRRRPDLHHHPGHRLPRRSTCWWTASRWGRSRPTPSATSPPTTPSRPASPSNNYTITASAGANGTIDPTGAVSVDYGADQTFTITPATGYHVARRAGGRRLGGGGHDLHLQRRHRRPHHRGELRGIRSPPRPARAAASTRRGRCGWPTAPTRPSPSPRPPATTSSTCWWTASRWGRSPPTPSATSPLTTPSRPASNSTPTRYSARSVRTVRSTRPGPCPSPTATTRPSPSRLMPATTY